MSINNGTINTPKNTIIDGHEYVDLGLSVMWATCNVGASSPSDIGSYFAWGEIGTKIGYNPNNSVAYKIKPYGITGNPQYDAATAIWKRPWRCPTPYEIEELVKECEWEQEIRNNSNGFKVLGNNGAHIFLPAAGRRYDKYPYYKNKKGYYWSSALASGNGEAIALYFQKKPSKFYKCDIGYGLCIRPVADRV